MYKEACFFTIKKTSERWKIIHLIQFVFSCALCGYTLQEVLLFVLVRKNWQLFQAASLSHFRTIISVFVSYQELDSLTHLADPRFSPYQGHNAFREKYFSGLNKRCNKEDNKPSVNGKWTTGRRLKKVTSESFYWMKRKSGHSCQLTLSEIQCANLFVIVF